MTSSELAEQYRANAELIHKATVLTEATTAMTKITNATNELVGLERRYLDDIAKIARDGRYSEEYREQRAGAVVDTLRNQLEQIAERGAQAIEEATGVAQRLQETAERTIEAGTRYEAIPVMARQYDAEMLAADRGSFEGPAAADRVFLGALASAVETADRTALHALLQVADERGNDDLKVKASRALAEAMPEDIAKARAIIVGIQTARAGLERQAYRLEATATGNMFIDGWKGGQRDAWYGAGAASPIRQILNPGSIPQPKHRIVGPQDAAATDGDES